MLFTSLIAAAVLAQNPSEANKPKPPACVLDTVGGLKYLYAKNPGSQVLVLEPVDGSDCTKFLAGKKAGNTVKLRRGGDGTTAIVTGTLKDHPDKVLIEVNNVDAIPEGAEAWTLETSSGPAAATMVLVVRTLEIKTERVTDYDDKILQDIARAHDLVQGVDFIAARFDTKSPMSPYQPSTRVTISAADLPAVDGSRSYWLLTTSALELPDAAPPASSITTGNPAKSALQYMPGLHNLAEVQEQRGLLSAPYVLQSLVGIRMVGRAESANPVQERLLYVQVDTNAKPLVLLDTPVKLAGSTRRLQLPLPIAASTYITCPIRPNTSKRLKEVADGERIAIHNSSVTNSYCNAVFSPDELRQAVAKRHGIPFVESTKGLPSQWTGGGDSCAVTRAARLNHGERCIDIVEPAGSVKPGPNTTQLEQLLQAYGSQKVAISISKDGVAAKDPEYVEIYVDAANREDKTLTFPDQEPEEDKPYTVTISSELAKEKKSTGTVSRMTLRPRGVFGFRAPIRMFVTVPVNITAIRFPASVRDAASSTESLRYQIRTFDVGALVSLEPWNYVRRKNSSPIPFRASTGFLFNPIQRPTAASWVIGGSFNFPLIEGTSQVDTSFAIGLYYEVDLRQTRAFKEGSHFLLTFGVNIFSLFGAESAKKK